MALLTFKIGYLTPEMEAKAEKELGETEEVRQRAIELLRKYISEDKRLVCTQDENFCLSFLRARKFDISKTIKLLNNYHQAKKSYPEVFVPDFPCFMRSIKKEFGTVMPYRDENGCVIVLFKMDKWNVEETKFALTVQHMTGVLLACVEDPATQVCGLKLIVDARGMWLKHILYIHPRYVYLIASGLKSSLPIRIKGLHFVGESIHARLLWNALSFVVSEKVRTRVHFHGTNYESLKKFFNPSLLPKEYGGSLDYDNEFWVKEIESMKQKYFDRLSCGYQ